MKKASKCDTWNEGNYWDHRQKYSFSLPMTFLNEMPWDNIHVVQMEKWTTFAATNSFMNAEQNKLISQCLLH